MQKIRTVDAIVDSLVVNGVDTLFGIPGAHTYDLYDALAGASSQIRHITTRHEQGAGYMAYGYAKSSGRPGVYSVVPGPGVLNSGAAVATGFGANTPMLCLTAEIPSRMIGAGRGILHELKDQLAVLKLLFKHAERVNHPSEVNAAMSRAFSNMLGGRQGPAAIEVPWDLMGQSAPVSVASEYVPQEAPTADPDLISKAIDFISKAKNPMIMVGSGAINCREEITALATRLQAPVVSHRSGRGIISARSPYGFTCAEAFARWPETDLLIGIGTRLELPYLRWKSVSDSLDTIRIDIDPTELVRLPATVGIISDAQSGVRDLIDGLESSSLKVKDRSDEFTTGKLSVAKSIREVQPQVDFLGVIRDVLPDDGFFVEEISQVGFAARFAFPVYEPRTYVSCGYQDNLGFGFNTALGVKVANPSKPVISVSGDGGFLFGVQELATAVHHRIGVVSVVFDNGCYGNVRRDQMEKYDGRLLGSDLTSPNFAKLADAFGAVPYTADDPTSLKKALEKALAADEPAVVCVSVPTGSEVSPWKYLMPGTY